MAEGGGTVGFGMKEEDRGQKKEEVIGPDGRNWFKVREGS
jgi:hypothetical protein